MGLWRKHRVLQTGERLLASTSPEMRRATKSLIKCAAVPDPSRSRWCPPSVQLADLCAVLVQLG